MRKVTCTLTSVFIIGILVVGGTMADGRIEINQASVEAAGGFPFTITAPGNYALTGDLTVPAETNGIVIDTNWVTIDLNGFSVIGPASCSPQSCTSGSGFGIVPQNFLTDGARSTVHNGTVRGFSGVCLLLTSDSRIEDVLVSECGLIGISLLSGVATGNRVSDTGQEGMGMGASVAFAHNHIQNAGLGGGGERAVSGGRASAGNSCDDLSCTPRGERRYYLTPILHDGNEVLDACAVGFHMASLWELMDTTQLVYDAALGETAVDMGSGPPTGVHGWIRTGSFSEGSSLPGRGNCNAWTSDSVDDFGSISRPKNLWDDPSRTISPWDPDTNPCSAVFRVWCVED